MSSRCNWNHKYVAFEPSSFPVIKQLGLVAGNLTKKLPNTDFLRINILPFIAEWRYPPKSAIYPVFGQSTYIYSHPLFQIVGPSSRFPVKYLWFVPSRDSHGKHNSLTIEETCVFLFYILSIWYYDNCYN